jgi:hypothetical protein
MLSVLSTGGGMQLYGVGGLGAAAAAFPILGVPFQWEKKTVNVLGNTITRYVLSGTNSIWVKKDKMPGALAKAIDQLIAKAATELLKSNPDLAKNPKELIKQAKYRARLTSPEKEFVLTAFMTAVLSNAYLGKITKVNGISTEARSILVKDMGTAYRVRLQDNPSGQSLPGISLLFDLAEGIAGGISGTINLSLDGLEAAMNGLVDLLDKLKDLGCKIADSVVADVTKTAVDAAATAKGGPTAGTLTSSATTAGLQKIRSMCSPAAPPKAPSKTPPPEIVVPWYKRPSTYVVGGGIVALGTIVTIAVRR